MAEILSQKQIDELLGSIQTGKMDFDEIEEQSTAKKVKEYDFLSPKKFTREQFKLLDSVFDNFSRLFSLHLTSTLRSSCQMEIAQIEEEEYREFNNALNDTVLVGVINMSNPEHGIEDKPILVEISRPVFYSVMDRLLGGNGEGYFIERNCTEIEIALLEYLFKQITSLLRDAWSNYMEIEHTLQMVETNSRLIQLIQPEEAVAIVVVEVTLKNLKGNVNICLPASSLQEIFNLFQSRYLKSVKKENPAAEQQRKDYILANIEDSQLPVTAILGKTKIDLREVLGLQVGDVIPLGTRVQEKAVQINVGDTPWFYGELGAKKKSYAIRIDRLY